MLGARIPPEWMKQFQELASERGCTVAELARKALGQYLGKESDIGDISDITLNSDFKDRLERIEARIGDNSDISDITLNSDFKDRLDKIESIIGDNSDIKPISQRLELLENQIQELKKEVITLIEIEKPVKTEKEIREIKENWLTTGEAYDEAKRRGLTQSLGTFRRWLREASEKQELPNTLSSLNLEANWTIRNQGNPKNNSLRWLQFL